MIINLENMKDEKKEIYSFLWGNKELDFELVETGKNDHFYEFSFGNKDILSFIGEKIADSFNLPNKDSFCEKFRMSCSGTGDELKKITTMHSSSLCALLFFYNVSNSNPLEIPGLEGYIFNKSYFEFKNKVIGYPSNIDVVLLGKNKEGKKVIFFVESKFSEYITGITKANNKYEIGKSYFKEDCFSKPIYSKILEELKITLETGKTYSLIPSENKYVEGIKQIISHYYGIRNFIEGEYYKKDNASLDEISNYGAEEFILGEVLFDNYPDSIKNNFLYTYENDYSKLAEIINEQLRVENQKNLRILNKSLRYSALEDYIMNLPKVHNYYFRYSGKHR